MIRSRRFDWDAVACVDALTILARLTGVSFGEAFAAFAGQMFKGAQTPYAAMVATIEAGDLYATIATNDPDAKPFVDTFAAMFADV